MLKVYSVFSSIQGESTFAGRPCGFVRLAGCPLNCIYCDTREVCDAPGQSVSIDHILGQVSALNMRLIEVTGGEPLAQPGAEALLTALCDAGYTVLLETSGAFPIDTIDSRVRVIMDIKCPGSGMADRMRQKNLDCLHPTRHEVKFVVSCKEDFNWAVALSAQKKLAECAELLVSPVWGAVSPRELASWLVRARVPMRMQLQLHKLIWPGGEENR